MKFKTSAKLANLAERETIIAAKALLDSIRESLERELTEKMSALRDANGLPIEKVYTNIGEQRQLSKLINLIEIKEDTNV